ncbi:hypothetical protein INR49_022643 [Caranx melampygus]|nr:hypothetical protein INR49_022643 [Caranx melampygus]
MWVKVREAAVGWIRPTFFRTMKAPLRPRQKNPPQKKKRSRAFSTLIYRAHKEVGMRSPDLLTGGHVVPRPVLLRLVVLEASRLSRANRVKVITVQEINAAAARLQHRICTRAAA